MQLSDIVTALHDNGNKLIIFKAYVPLIGLKATVLLMHLNTSINNRYRVCTDENGVLWHRQNLLWMSRQSSLSEAALRRAKKTLVDLGLIELRHTASYDRTTYWRVQSDKLARFCLFAHALYAATRPDNTYTLPQWQKFARENPDIVEEFRPLYPRLGQFCVRQEMEPVRMIRRIPPPAQEAGPKMDIKGKAAFQSRQTKKKKEGTPCRFVEFWNSLPCVPKCRCGTKSYATASRFFAAYRRYEAGSCSEFILTQDEQERIRLDKVNRIPPDALRHGSVPVRPDEQMFRHIALAARSYQPEYWPRDKSKLPRDLPSFLYTAFSKRYGSRSLFLERVGIFRPKLLEEVSQEGILAAMSPEETDTVQVLKKLYDEANSRAEDTPLSLRELKAALRAAQGILSKYDSIPVDRVSIFASHFGSFDWFLDWFRSYAEDHLWEGMPMSAFDPSMDLWRRFVDFVSSDIGYDLFTGERI